MADLTGKEASQSVIISGANPSTGVETNYLQVDSSGSAQTTLKNSSGTSLSTTTYSSATALQIVPQDGPFIDGVNRLRVSDVSVLGSFCFNGTTHDLNFNSSLSGGGSVSFNANASATRLSVGTASGDSAIRQTKRYFSYSPGIAHSYSAAATIGAKKTNVRQRWGQFDANDGTFFEQTGTDLAVVIRSSTSGSPVDTRVLQANWNIDKLDGTGASGINLDTSKHNKYMIHSAWYGAGRVRFGIEYNGQIIYCHEYNGANINTVPYSRTPKLPMRFELTNTGTAASSTNLDIVCLAVIQEASSPFIPQYNFSKSSLRTGVTVGSTLIPLLSIRSKTTFNGITNRSTLLPAGFQGMANQQSLLVQLILNPTLTGASFTSVNTQSAAEFDTSATALSGGTVVAEFFVPATGEVTKDLHQYAKDIILGLDVAGSTSDIMTVAVQSVSGNPSAWVAIDWEELQ